MAAGRHLPLPALLLPLACAALAPRTLTGRTGTPRTATRVRGRLRRRSGLSPGRWCLPQRNSAPACCPPTTAPAAPWCHAGTTTGTRRPARNSPTGAATATPTTSSPSTTARRAAGPSRVSPGTGLAGLLSPWGRHYRAQFHGVCPGDRGLEGSCGSTREGVQLAACFTPALSVPPDCSSCLADINFMQRNWSVLSQR